MVIIGILQIFCMIGLGVFLYFLYKQNYKIGVGLTSIPIQDVDVTLKELHSLVKREFLFALDNWFREGIGIKSMSNPLHQLSIVNNLKDSKFIEEKVNYLVAYISGRISSHIKAGFRAVYKDDDTDEELQYYISRLILFYIKRVNTDITILFEDSRTQNIDTDELIKAYFLDIEKEIYENNYIAVIEPETNKSQEQNVKE